ncbi:MAG TPA: GntR family transcriptional regulator [Thermovirgaceae bacterium]|nr:GntR family transcriptional regulator [Thermovirgaceae bacterium]
MTPDCPFNMVSLRQQVYDYLRSQMNQGELRPGSAINLGEMSSRFGISRTPLREALLQLETEGFVTIYPRKGIIVNPLSEEDIRHAYEIIGALEASVVFNERNSITSTETEKMRRLNLLMREALDRDDFDTFYRHNISFHNIYLDLSRNQSLVRTVMTLKQRLYDFPRRKGFVKEWEITSTGEHERFIELLETGDAKAASDYMRDVHWSFEVQRPWIHRYYRELAREEALERSAEGVPR